MKKLIYIIFIFSSILFLSGCFDFLNPSNKQQSTTNTVSQITAAQFSGIGSAVNVITGIKLSWAGVTNTNLVSSYNVYRVQGSSLTLLASLAPSLTSFIDGTVTAGSIYEYMVKAVDTNGVEDSNTAVAKSLAWSGIASVTGLSRTSLQVALVAPAAVVDEVRIYGQLSAGSSKTLLATATGSDTTVTISSLRTGYNYIISAEAYVASLGKEDGNTVTFTANTLTVGYDTDGASTPQWGNVMAVRAFGEAPAAPVHPNTPNKSPSSRVVELAFLPFTSAGASATYVVTRVVDGNEMDTTTTTNCTSSTTTSCLVCSGVSIASGVVSCRDTNVGAAPTKYRYTMALVQTDTTSGDTWVEPFPDDEQDTFSVLVPIPPKNMVLVQRDAANYEMCIQLNKASDPLNHNRCSYSSVGAVPYSSGNNKLPLNLPTNYYDFGYDLFVDRWEMACNWTRATQGGMCGANHTSGDCIGYGYTSSPPNGTGTPATTQGKLGDVYFYMGTSNISMCWVAAAQNSSTQAITWVKSASIAAGYANASTLYQESMTNDPGYIDSSGNYNTAIPGKKGKVSYYIDQPTASNICSAMVDANYGAKRLPRSREYVVFSAPPLLTGEPYSTTYSSFWTNILGTGSSTYHDSSHYYACENSSTNKDVPPTSLTQLLDYTDYPAYKEMMAMTGTDSGGYSGTFGILVGAQFMTGAVATIDCQSRYGVQDVMRNSIMSDEFYYNYSTYKATGVMSPFDNGNRDYLSDLSGGTSGFAIDVSVFTQSGTYATTSYTGTAMTAFIPALGLPVTASSYSSDYLPRASIVQPYGLTMNVPGMSLAASETTAVRRGYRWGMVASVTEGTLNPDDGQVRCVLPAE